MDFSKAENEIEAFISKKVSAAKAGGVVVGLSGGLDSAVVATLSARALGPEKVLGLLMPSANNSPHDIEDAQLIAQKLKMRTKIIPIKAIMDSFAVALERQDRAAVGNLAARIRMCLLYYHANLMNYLVAGTGNKSEIAIGYFTKYGDGGSDLLPIGGLYKTQVRGLAAFLGIPKKVIERVPTAGLWPGQTDEGEMGMSYADLDMALAGKSPNLKVHKMAVSSEHKRKMPEVCKLQ